MSLARRSRLLIRASVRALPPEPVRAVSEEFAPLVRLLTWALADSILPPDSPSAYEYMIIAEADAQ